ncbi:hypothetical protein B2J88_39860 [Rhodococcus sp. SRB_17]|uniref:DUF445 domain-containing protein n=1 Tax=Acidovorax sp. SRB_24 TaxID=1962700 RepID=UPI00145D3D2D|nr:DUF445 domain-containing protein [Acidovorax sp. SRB_24]NMM77750.1 hypothetical protein [Acidovorax sp. SRB_24]NMM77780.1 hypothetical protein [Acidovorax sp. SRB_24]NMM90422.1 hypothetical protein [Rhodococcus sp. SRB_17]
MPDQTAALQRAKRFALALLLLATAVFVATSLAPRSLAVDGLKAVAEAAMVGALADWFAVRALFHRVPIPFIARHTAIVPRNKDRIGRNLARFVRDKFLDADSLVALVRRHDLVARVGEWLLAPGHAQLLGQQVARMLSAALDMVQDRQVEHFIRKAARTLIGQIDLSQALARTLGALTQGDRHQALLGDAIAQLIALLQREDTRTLIARTLVHWLKTEHPLKEKMLPTDWLGDKGAAMLAHALEGLLAEVAANPQHQLRAKFDEAVQLFIARLQSDPAWARKADEIRHYLQTNATLGRYVQELWQGLRASLQRDLADGHSAVARNVRAMGQWLGASLAQDPALREALNARLAQWVHGLAPDVAQFVAQHMEDTVQRWDAQEMSQIIELNIGKDLQTIRINGTVVGGLIGLVLFAVSHMGEIARAMGLAGG